MGDAVSQERQGLLSPFLQSRRIAAAAPYVRGSVLDVGCGASGELARRCSPETYLGLDIDPAKVARAAARMPEFRFTTEWPVAKRFDTVAGLAVIEHLPEPGDFLERLAVSVEPGGGRVVLTTPAPRYAFVHAAGAAMGVFSREAAAEHQELLDRRAISLLAQQVGLRVTVARSFLFGANQLFVLEPTRC